MPDCKAGYHRFCFEVQRGYVSSNANMLATVSSSMIEEVEESYSFGPIKGSPNDIVEIISIMRDEIGALRPA